MVWWVFLLLMMVGLGFFLLGGGEEIEYDNADHTSDVKCFFYYTFHLKFKSLYKHPVMQKLHETGQSQLPNPSVPPM